MDHVLSRLADERRSVVADWRLHILYHRTARSHGFRPPDSQSLRRLIRKLMSKRILEPIAGVVGVYRVIVPYASSLPTPDEVILSEANPTGSLAFFTALFLHGLTVEIPRRLYAISSNSRTRSPLGTTTDDWVDLPEPSRRFPKTIENRPVHWTRAKPSWDIGVDVGFIEGSPVYVTSLEKTLVDALRFPGKSGGASTVIPAWQEAAPRVDGEALITIVENYDQALLRQRVGFMCEQVGLNVPALNEWSRRASRGGSAKLLAHEPFSPQHSVRWNLSINVPSGLLPRPEEIEGCF